jgi:hypothetical protein
MPEVPSEFRAKARRRAVFPLASPDRTADDPSQDCERVADLFAKQQSSERIKLFVQEIKLELDDPTQQVRDILECHASEDDLRKYLRCVADRLNKIE